MNITEVRVKLIDGNEERLRAFCSVTYGGALVIRDLKIIDGANGPFVAMPSRKLTDHCPTCGCRNHLRARYCNHCGGALPVDRAATDVHGRVRLHADVAHPIHSEARDALHAAVIFAYEAELQLAAQPGYRPTADDGSDGGDGPGVDFENAPYSTLPAAAAQRRSAGASHARSGGFGAGIL